MAKESKIDDNNGNIIYKKAFGLKETKETCIKKIPEAITSAFIEFVSTKIKNDYKVGGEVIDRQRDILSEDRR